MLPLTIRTIAAVVGGEYRGDAALLERCISSVVRDNREVVEDSLFLCFRGERVDGHSFAASAFASGAICAIAERLLDGAGAHIIVDDTAQALKKLGAHYRNLLKIPVIGVVGSVGKTTMKELIAAALGAKMRVLKTDKNLNNELGVPLTLLSIGEEHDAAVIEMGISDFGEMTRLAEMARPDIVVFTAVGHSHLEQLGDLDGVLRAKAEVFPLMPRDGVAVLCGDDAHLRGAETGLRTLYFGTDEHNDYRAENITADGTNSCKFNVITPSEKVAVELQAYGLHLASSSAGAVAVGELLGLSQAEIARGLSSYAPIDGRANTIITPNFTLIDDCYNANPDSMASSLRSLSGLAAPRRVAILGDMKELGANENELHRNLGLLIGSLNIDVLICLGEKAEFIFKGFIASKAERERYHFPLREAFFAQLPSLIKKGDAILVKASHSMNFNEIVDFIKKL